MNIKTQQFERILVRLSQLTFSYLPNPALPAFKEIQQDFNALETQNQEDIAFLVLTWIQFYQGDLVAAQQTLATVKRSALTENTQSHYDTLRWIFQIDNANNPLQFQTEFEQWQADAEKAFAIFVECFWLKRLSREAKYLFQLESRLMQFQSQITELTLPIYTLATYHIADTYTTIIDQTELGLQWNMRGFQLAQNQHAHQLEFAFLHNIALIYRHNHLVEEAITYFLQALEIYKKTTVINASLLVVTYFQLISTYIDANLIERAQYYYRSLTVIAHKQRLTAETATHIELISLFLSCYQSQTTFETIWPHFLRLTEQYLALPVRMLPALETYFLTLEALIHERFTANTDQLLYIYFTHLNHLHEHAPGKYLAIASLYKKIASTYKQSDDYLLAWSYYQAYNDSFSTWHHQNFTDQFKAEYDIFDVKLQQQKLAHLEASTNLLKHHHQFDPLTKLFTRQMLHHELETASITACAIIDCDYFKQFNDTFGHQNGDRALQTIATVILQTLSPDYKAFRYGGEEFLLLYYGTDYQNFTTTLIQLVTNIAKTPIQLSNQAREQFVTVSVGAHWQQQTTFDFEVAFQLADQALYQVKANGRNHVRFT